MAVALFVVHVAAGCAVLRRGGTAAVPAAQRRHLEKQHAEGIDIHERRHDFVLQKFRRQIVRSSAQAFRNSSEGPRTAPVHQIDLAEISHEDVFRLDVPVHDFQAVAVLHHGTDFEKIFQTRNQCMTLLRGIHFLLVVSGADGADEAFQ